MIYESVFAADLLQYKTNPKRKRKMIVDYTLDELQAMENLTSNMTWNLKFNNRKYRIWLSKIDNITIRVDKYVAGEWSILTQYKGI